MGASYDVDVVPEVVDWYSDHKPNTGDVGSCPDPHLTVLGFHLFKSSGFNGHFDITVKL